MRHTVAARNSAFAFQGRSNENGAAANGLYDREFRLYESPAGGSPLGALTRENVPVTNEILTVRLGYGADVFGGGRYLEIGVRGASTGGFGYFRFENVPAGATYVLTFHSERFVFATPTRITALTDDLTEVDFTGEP